MNRIVLIGNGFDLAHGMKTSYQDFIFDYLNRIVKEAQDPKYNYSYKNRELSLQGNLSELSELKLSLNFIKGIEDLRLQLKFHNGFLALLLTKGGLEKWVDIENEYYLMLKNCAKSDFDREQMVISLNQDFKDIKSLFVEYLQRVEENEKTNPRITMNIGPNIFSTFKYRELFGYDLYAKSRKEYEKYKIGNTRSLSDRERGKAENLHLYLENQTGKIRKIRALLKTDQAEDYMNMSPDQVLFLSFNYTETHFLYTNKTSSNIHGYNYVRQSNDKSISIHGNLRDDKSMDKMIFGFGDELDESYQNIENLNDNRYLENIKSIKYSESSNYRELMEFLESGQFQICIFGHSCGISDRTLLNTLFEHENCISIKPYYHKINDTEDNYSDLVRNISRNFKDKRKMRNLLVNKTYCKPLTS